MQIETYIYFTTSTFLVYFINLAKVTSCYEPVLPRITVLTSQTLNLSQWRENLDVDIITFPARNLSFYETLEITEAIHRATQGQNGTSAVVGSGNTVIDRLIASTVSLSVPFISVIKYDGHQDPLYLNLRPSTLVDHTRIIFDIAVELGCHHVAVFTSSFHNVTVMQQIQTSAKTPNISFSTSHLFLNDTPLGIVRMMNEIYEIAINYTTVLLVMDCSEEDALFIVKSTETISIRPIHFRWLFLRGESHEPDRVEYLPTDLLGIRSKFEERNWMHDALILLNGSLHVRNQNEIGIHGSFSSNVNNRLKLYRKMLDQAFLGKTGWVQFDEEGNRVAASYDIIKTSRVNSSNDGEVAWVAVGSAAGGQISLNESFWMDNVHDYGKALRVVVIEEDPMLFVSKENVAVDSECVLSHPCTKYKQNDNNSEYITPVKCCCIGYLIDVLHWLEKDLSVAAELYLVRDGKFGAYNAKFKEWNGMIADLLSHKADLALSTLTMTKIRAKYVDFSHPFLHGETKLLISVSTEESNLEFGFLAPFNEILWITLLVSVNAILVTVWALERMSPNGYRKRFANNKNRFSLSTCMSYIWNNVVKLELEGMKPQSFSARFTTAVFSFSTLILVTSYTANLTASLVQLDVKSPVTGIEDPKFQDPPPGFTFTTLQSSSTLSFFTDHDDAGYQRIGRNMMPHVVKNYNHGLEKLRKREIDAFIYDSPFIDLGASKMPGCSFKVIGNPIITKVYAMAFPRNSKWRDTVSKLLLKYEEKDYFRKLKDKWFRGGCFYSDRASKSAYKMKPENFSGLLFILCGAMVICFLLLFGEYLWSRYERKAGKYTPKKIRQSNTNMSDEQQTGTMQK